jgi:hypothetical protein
VVARELHSAGLLAREQREAVAVHFRFSDLPGSPSILATEKNN